MFPGLATEKDLVPVWVCAGDFCALGLLPPGAQCDETIHVLLSLPYWLVLKLWHKGRGRSSSGEPLVAFDGRLILAKTRKPVLLVQSSRLAKYAALPLAALAGSAQAQSSLSPVQSLQTQLRQLGKIDHFSKFGDLKTIEENTVRQDPGFVAKAMIDRNLGEWVGSYNDYTNMYAFKGSAVLGYGSFAYKLPKPGMGLCLACAMTQFIGVFSVADELSQVQKCAEQYLYKRVQELGKLNSFTCRAELAFEENEPDTRGVFAELRRLVSKLGNKEINVTRGFFSNLQNTAETKFKETESWWDERKVGTSLGSLREIVQALEKGGARAKVFDDFLTTHGFLIKDLARQIGVIKASELALEFSKQGLSAFPTVSLPKEPPLPAVCHRNSSFCTPNNLSEQEVAECYRLRNLVSWIPGWVVTSAGANISVVVTMISLMLNVLSFSRFCRGRSRSQQKFLLEAYGKIIQTFETHLRRLDTSISAEIQQAIVSVDNSEQTHKLKIDNMQLLYFKTGATFYCHSIFQSFVKMKENVLKGELNGSITLPDTQLTKKQVWDYFKLSEDQQNRLNEAAVTISGINLWSAIRTKMDTYVGILSNGMAQLDLLANNPGAEESERMIERVRKVQFYYAQYSCRALLRFLVHDVDDPVWPEALQGHSERIYEVMRRKMRPQRRFGIFDAA